MNNVTKIELCSRVLGRLNLNKKISLVDCKNIIEIFIDEIFSCIAEGKRIEIRGFGCFKPVTRNKRIGRNPKTGETVDIPSYTAPYFKFSKEAKKIFEKKLKKT